MIQLPVAATVVQRGGRVLLDCVAIERVRLTPSP
jgi:hypothetical protein